MLLYKVMQGNTIFYIDTDKIESYKDGRSCIIEENSETGENVFIYSPMTGTLKEVPDTTKPEIISVE